MSTSSPAKSDKVLRMSQSPDPDPPQLMSISSTFTNHLGKMLSEESVKIMKEFREHPKLKINAEVSQIRMPKLGSLSVMKPMIDENRSSNIKRLDAPERNELKQYFSQEINLNDVQSELFSLLSSYRDLIYTNESLDNIEEVQKVYILHAFTHLFNSRSAIVANNKFFEKKNPSDNILQDDPKLRDQGYTRAKVLFLLPFRHSALRLGKNIAQLLGDQYNIINLDRFIKEFGDDGEDSTLRPVASDGNKPSDFYHIFHGNTDDAFRVGLRLTKKSLKFFADFYESDIIIASPLGLKTIISPDEHQAAAAVASIDGEQLPPSGDKDFLSSIEIIILDQADIFMMQNWEHVLDIMQCVNLMPEKPRNMDVSRVRSWYLEDWSKYYRQIIMFASISMPLLHSFFQTHSLNYEGYLTYKHRVENPQVKLLTSKVKQQFLYFNSTDAKDSCDDRFNFFTRQVLPKYLGRSDKSSNNLDHTMIFVSSYFDYVRVRNHFRRDKLSFTQICEYTEENKVAKARQLFYFGARQFLLYTERCHFYNRYKIKGIRNIIFYDPPLYAKFYAELVNMLTPDLQGKKYADDPIEFEVSTLFSNHDTLQLGAIIGYGNAFKLIQGKKSIT